MKEETRLYPKAYLHYLVLFHRDRDYFACHEVLEDYWKKDPAGERQPRWVFLIQVAVALYHYRRGNLAGAKKLIMKARYRLNVLSKETAQLGLDKAELSNLLGRVEKSITERLPYQDISLPISDPRLKKWLISRLEH